MVALQDWMVDPIEEDSFSAGMTIEIMG